MGANKQLRQRIAGLRQIIEVHRIKIQTELTKPLPNLGTIRHWRGEIAEWERQIAKLEKKLP
jgi:hypothetical protein